MKIAVPSNDRINLSMHFGRSNGFIIFETGGQEIINEEYRENRVTGHALGHHEDYNQGSQGEHNHSHDGIINAFADCETVIAGGMGQRLYTDLLTAGKNVFITREENAKQAVILFLKDKLDNNPGGYCNH
jgi:predicted Fe-Mo cluster-binding NifX family protein